MGRAVLVAVAVVVALVLLIGTLWVFQDRVIYFPYGPAAGRAADTLPDAREVVLRTDDGLELGAWFLPAAEPRRDVAVLVANGNGGNRSGRAPLAAALARNGVSVLLFDYRGYGGNPGRPSEDGLARDARAARAALLAQPEVRTARVMYFGESLGAAVVARLATEHAPAGLLLRSPFFDLASVAETRVPFVPVRPLLRERYPVAEMVGRVRSPTTVVYGTADAVVPPEQSIRVAGAAAGTVRVVAVPGAGHNDAVFLDGTPIVSAVLELAARASGGG